jgi:hypothetical protein
VTTACPEDLCRRYFGKEEVSLGICGPFLDLPKRYVPFCTQGKQPRYRPSAGNLTLYFG